MKDDSHKELIPLNRRGVLCFVLGEQLLNLQNVNTLHTFTSRLVYACKYIEKGQQMTPRDKHNNCARKKTSTTWHKM